MKPFAGIFAAAFIAVAAFAQPEPPKPVTAPKTVESAAIDEYLAAKVKQSGAVGLSVAVYRDGIPVIAKVYGAASTTGIPPLRGDTAFAIGSITKQFACAAIFQLNEKGKLFYRDSVSKYFPEATRGNDITLYDLMTHTSGYRDYYPLDFLDRRMMKAITPDDLIKQFSSDKLDFEPGSRWSYSNTGYVMLGRIVERITGEPFGKYIDRTILKPARMNHSYFEPAADSPNVARGHTSVLLAPPEPIPLEIPNWLHAAGALFCTANDLAKWDLALMSGQVIGAESWKTMITPRELTNGKLQNYGCGLSVTRQDGELVLSHSGAVSGFHAYNTMIPRTKSIIIVLCNDEHADSAAIHRELVSLVMNDLKKRDDPVPKIKSATPKEAAGALFKQMQSGTVDRGQLGEEFNFYLTENRLRDAAPRLKEYGEPTAIDVQGLHERGGLEACTVRFTFKVGVLKASMFRSPDGKIEQFLIGKG